MNVRILAASHRPLEALIKAGELREDLYYRLNVVTILIPPLRERRADVSLLMDHFLRHYAAKNGKTIRGLTPEGRDVLLRYDYPGNVRELENIIERAVVLTRDDVIGSGDLGMGERALRYKLIKYGFREEAPEVQSPRENTESEESF